MKNALDIILYFKHEQNFSFISNTGNMNMTKLLAKHGADVDTKDNNGIAPLHKAAAHGKFVKILSAMSNF